MAFVFHPRCIRDAAAGSIGDGATDLHHPSPTPDTSGMGHPAVQPTDVRGAYLDATLPSLNWTLHLSQRPYVTMAMAHFSQWPAVSTALTSTTCAARAAS